MRGLFCGLFLLLSACSPLPVVDISVSPVLPDLGRPLRLHDSWTFTCSGILIAPELVLTAAHCLPSSASVEGLLITSTYRPGPEDAALLEVPGLVGVYVPLGVIRPGIGDEVTLSGWGCSKGRSLGRRTGFVMSVHTDVEGTQADISTHACPGDSGGPVYDRDGRLVGLIRGTYMPRYAMSSVVLF